VTQRLGAPQLIVGASTKIRLNHPTPADNRGRQPEVSGMTSDRREIYAVRYAYHDRRAGENFLGGDPQDGPMRSTDLPQGASEEALGSATPAW
jgi:hypothetical protein